MKDTPTPVDGGPSRGLPRDLSKIVDRCLAKDVEDRYQSAKDLRNDLRALKNDLTSGEIVPITGIGVERAPSVGAPARVGVAGDSRRRRRSARRPDRRRRCLSCRAATRSHRVAVAPRVRSIRST